MSDEAIRLSVILCTFNPQTGLLSRALTALRRQDLKPSAYEVIVVDNNSNPALSRSGLEMLVERDVRLVSESRQGLAYARAAGIRAARADLICFVDDDNELDENYLSAAIAAARKYPRLGVFGGVAIGVPEANATNFFWRTAAPFLGVRDIGASPEFSDGSVWRACEPIGAGICVRRSVADAYADYVLAVEDVGGLGRCGGKLLSGEDSLFSRIGFHLGADCGFIPELRLKHHITSRRLRLAYLMRLMEGHGRSYVLLERVNGRTFFPVPQSEERKMVAKNFLHRVASKGLAYAVLHLPWDVGLARQSRETEALTPDRTLPNFLLSYRAAANLSQDQHGAAALTAEPHHNEV